MATNTRAIAAKVLGEVLTGKSLNQVLPPALDRVPLRDRGLLQQLCYGTLRQEPQLQAVLKQVLGKPLKDKDADIQGLLLCGLYQLQHTRIPDHAAVGETVGATKTLKKPWARGMVNAILRRFQREGVQLLTNLDDAAATSHPRWLYQSLQQQWPENLTAILDANNSQPPMTLRVNSARLSREACLEKLAAADIEACAGELGPHAIYLSQAVDVSSLPGFDLGELSIQDESAQLAAMVLDASPGDRVLDACAAPGGKSCHILELQPELEELVAADIDHSRLERVEQNLERLALRATIIATDAAKPDAGLATESFDRILVDAPCSATGVIRRHPDVKLLRRESDIAQMAAQQLDIITGLWPLLKRGGSLLYATCSVLKEENDEVVEEFLSQQPDAQLGVIDANWGTATVTGRQVLPQEDGPDGLFYARLRKTAV